MTRPVLGNERLWTEDFQLIEGQRVGLITNHSGVDGHLRSTADRLHCHPSVNLSALFGPEHGIRGDANDGCRVNSTLDRRTGLNVYSLYGCQRQPTAEQLTDIDILLFDIQDVGARFYTYLYTMSLSMEACAAHETPFAVLDRPNPIGGEHIEGNLLEPTFRSFVGRYPIPIRHGMTTGEIARLFNQEFDIGAELHVVELRGWKRQRYWDQTGLQWVPPSPNMPTVDTAVVYPGMCLFEGTNVSEGRGTCKPFEQIGAPYIDGQNLAAELNEHSLPGAIFRSVCFRPGTGKYSGKICEGIHLHVVDRPTFNPVQTALTVLNTILCRYPREFSWQLPRTGIHNFDRLAGTNRIRLALEAGSRVEELIAEWKDDIDAFNAQRQDYLLY